MRRAAAIALVVLASAGCASGDDEADDTTTSGPTTTEEAGGTGSYVGALVEDGDDGGRVVINRVELEVTEDEITGEIELMSEGHLFEGSEQLDCLYLLVRIEPGTMPATGEGTYAGALTGDSAFPDGACPTDGTPAIEDSTTGGELDITVRGDTLTGTAGEGGEVVFRFTATREA